MNLLKNTRSKLDLETDTIEASSSRLREVEYYLKKVTKYGLNLDSRSDLTKTDWMTYASALTFDKEKSKKIYQGIANFLREGVSRTPFSDLYHTETTAQVDFQNRSVQGGIFILLLRDKSVNNKR